MSNMPTKSSAGILAKPSVHKRTTRWLATVALLMLGQLTPAAAQNNPTSNATTNTLPKTVVIGAEDDWYPYAGKVAGEARGLGVDIVRESFAAEGISVNFAVVPYPRCMQLTKAGSYLACFNTSRTSATENDFHWPNKPMFSPICAIYARKGSNQSKLGVRDLEGKRVSVTRSYEYGSEFDSNTKVQRVVADRDLSGFQMLAAGRSDYMLAFDKVANHLLRENAGKLANKFEPVGIVTQTDIYLAFSKTYPDNLPLMEAFNRGFASIVKNGTYAKIEKRWQ